MLKSTSSSSPATSTLPAASSTAPESTTRRKRRRSSNKVRAAKQAKPWVLLGEDDDDMRELLCHVLRENGFSVTATRDGQELAGAIGDAMAKRGPVRFPDLLISDVRMPKHTGISVLQSLRRAGWDIPVIIITAFPDRETRKTVRSLDAVMFAKPFSVHDFLARVGKILERAS